MKFLFYIGHPAQYFFLRKSIADLKSSGHIVLIIIKTKDILEEVLSEDGFNYINILPSVRGNSKIAILVSLFVRIFRLFPIIVKEKPDLMISTDASIAIIGNLLNKRRITITEDDYKVIRHLASITYPFTETILCPTSCDVGKYTSKKVGYAGYMKLAYLHPNVFKPDFQILSKYNIPQRFVLIRLAKLTAHHDFGIKGISAPLLDKIIDVCKKLEVRVYISSEAQIDSKFQPYKLDINASEMHYILVHATLFISDSQSMSVEAAMLGTPSIRFSDFVGKISVLEELEHRYNLTFGVKTSDESGLILKIFELLQNDVNRVNFIKLRDKMLSDKIDVSAFLTWFLLNYPNSRKILIENPEFQQKFK